MNKLIVAFMLAAFLFGMLDGVFTAGSTGIVTTELTQDLSDTGTTAYVISTSGLPEAGEVLIGDEIIPYNGRTATTLTNLTRGDDAEAHDAGRKVFTSETGLVSEMRGYQNIEAGSSVGTVNIFNFPQKFVTDFLPDMTTFDFGFMQYNEAGQIFGYLCGIFSIGFWFMVAYYVLTALGGGLLQGALRFV